MNELSRIRISWRRQMKNLSPKRERSWNLPATSDSDLAAAARAREALVDLFPIDQAVPERLEILRPRVAVVDVIRVLPHVAAKDRAWRL